MTIKGYAARKGWGVRRVAVGLTGASVDGTYVIKRHLTIEGDLEGDQRERLIEIANKCPVHRTPTGQVGDQYDGGELHEQGHHQALKQR